MINLKIISYEKTFDKSRDCALIVASLVRPELSNKKSDNPVFINVLSSEFPDTDCPSGPLVLLDFPKAEQVILRIEHYRPCAILAGPVLFYLVIYDPAFDPTPLIGKVYYAQETTGPGGAEPLFSGTVT